MKLRTSYFNLRVLLKNLTRFAPLWVLYAVGELLGLMSLDLENEAAQLANDLNYLMGPVSIFHLVYALLVAACLFGDLFDSRMCNGLHAMPMRREGWLLTNLVSGLVFALIPALVGGGVAALFLAEYWWIALIWQGTSLLQFMFFFGLAVFCAMCAGKRIGMIAMYGILNFLSMLVFWVVTVLYEPLLPGVKVSDYWFAKLCPVVSMAGSMYLDYYYDCILGGTFRGFVAESFSYLGICATVGVVFMILAWLLYRKRPLEKAGDFIAFHPMGIFFLLSYTFALGVLLYSFGDLLGIYQHYGFLAVGILIGWFTGWMLLERTVKIFTKKVLTGLVVFCLIFTGSLGLTLLDPLDIVSYIPENEEISSANLYLQSDVYYYDTVDGWEGWQITDPEEITWIQQLHAEMLETEIDHNSEAITVYIRYEMKNGNYINRTYHISAENQVTQGLKRFFSDPRAVLNVGDFQQVKDNMRDITVYTLGGDKYLVLNSDTEMQVLLDAIEADCNAGTMAQHDYFHSHCEYVAGVDICWNDVYQIGEIGDISGIRGEHIVIYEDCLNTIAVLESLDLS